ncbi:MAG: MotA/TolQ/ExbB proton channel family protein [Desulfobaccales bacterium]
MSWANIINVAVETGGAGTAPGGSDWDVLGAILAAGPVVRGVMLVLLIFSVLSWAIIISKLRQLRRARREDAEFYRLFWAAPDLAAACRETAHLAHSPAASILRQTLTAGWSPNPSAESPSPGGSLLTHPREEASRRAMRRALAEQGEYLGRSLSFLATCGNTAPFIGLFGTVWGIMSSFHNIGFTGSASLVTVAPGIAEALIATAAGLAAAIPAVMAYNYFLGQVRRLQAELRDFANDLAPLVKVLAAHPPEKEG